MAATDGQVVVAASRWSDEGHYLREFVSKNRLPSVAKIIKGQYGGLGVPTLPSPGLQSTALLISAGKKKKIIAQAVKLKEGRRIVSVGPRIVIPETYKGYFELLSEEGRAGRCMESVADIARRRLEDGCLVREPIRAICAKVDIDGNVTTDGARTLPAGEVVLPKGEAQLGSKGKYLKCTDSRGDIVLLSLDQRGKFSAIAKEDNISGVHTARTLLTKRLPITVRLVHGTPPRGLKSASHFVPEIRLLSVFEEEHVFALPLQKEGNALISLPLAAPLKMQKCRNEEQIKNFMEFARLVEKSSRLLLDVVDRIHMLDGKLGDPKRLLNPPPQTPPIKTGYFLRRSASSDAANSHKHSHILHHSHIYSHKEEKTPLPDEYDEIDQIYDYVRGFAPLPKSIKSSVETQRHESAPSTPAPTPIHMPLLSENKPEPPPIETIPTKKLQNNKAEKRTRKSGVATVNDKSPAIVYREKCSVAPIANLPKLFVKNSGNQKNRMVYRQKSHSPTKEQPSSPIASPLKPLSKGGSPLFNIRYKSLSNIHQAMELDGTLDSSHSGGRTSGDSGAGPKLPEKRSRRLSRPKSLTNLVWELRGCPVEVEKPKARKDAACRKSGVKLSLGSHKRAPTLYL